MNHSDVKSYMADYLEGDLSLDRRALLDAHLDGCEACSREVDEMRATISLLQSLPEPVVPAGIADQVMRRIRAGEARPHLADRLRQLAEALLAPRILAPLSAAALGAGLALWSGQVQLGPVGRSAETAPLQVTLAVPDARGSESFAARFSSDAIDGLSDRPLGASAAGQPAASGAAPGMLYSDAWPRPGAGLETDVLAGLTDLRSLSNPGQLAVSPGERVPQALQVASNRLRPAVVTGRDLPSADDWLSLIEQQPVVFADRLAGLSLAEQELWIDRLARRAHETGRFGQVFGALDGSPNGKQLASDFAAVTIAVDRGAGSSDGTSGGSN